MAIMLRIMLRRIDIDDGARLSVILASRSVFRAKYHRTADLIARFKHSDAMRNERQLTRQRQHIDEARGEAFSTIAALARLCRRGK